MLRKRITWLFLSVVAFAFVTGLSAYTHAAKPVREPEPYSPPTWSTQLDSTNGDDVTGCGSSRFECVLDGEAVLDKETGLVWDKTPDTGTRTWTQALTHCFKREVGGRKGWRAPTFEELLTLVDNTLGPPTLPSGHPFSNVQSSPYWSSATLASITTGAWLVNFANGGDIGSVKTQDIYHVWCVRGHQGYDAY